MFESCFEKYREADKPINQYPIHAREYAEQLFWLTKDFGRPFSAEESLRLISRRILAHEEHTINHPACAQCEMEPIK